MGVQFLLSAGFGIFFSISMHSLFKFMGIELDLFLTVFSMTGISILSCIFFILYKKVLDKRYARIESEIPCPVFYKTNGNFDLGEGKIKNGNLYFCDVGIICVSMEKNPYTLNEILIQNIYKISYDTIHLHIHTKDGRLFKITLPDASDVVELLKQKDWVE